MNTMFISDTHGQHDNVLLPRGKMIIHAGNVTRNGTEKEVVDFLHWFSHLPYDHKIFIAGTSDHFFEQNPERVRRLIPQGVTYLQESGVEIAGFKIWGSPYNSYNHGSAFSCTEGEINRHWDKMPDDADMVIAHNPAYGMLDENAQGQHEGCKVLLRRLVKVEPRYFVCGHNHGAHGYRYYDGIHFINAAMTNDDLQVTYKPVFQWHPN